MPSVMSSSLRLFGVGALVLMATACSASDDPRTPVMWGNEATQFFEALSGAHTADDFYGILDFYSNPATVEMSRAELSGAVAISDRLAWNSGDLKHDVMSIHLDVDGALNSVRWASNDEPGVVISSVDNGVIGRQIVYDLGSALKNGLRSEPTLVSRYEEIYAAYAEAWSGGNTEEIVGLYAPGAVVTDSIKGIENIRIEAVNTSSFPGTQIKVTSASDEIGSPSLYLGPSAYSEDPLRAVGIYRVSDNAACAHYVAVRWKFADGLIIEERRYHEADSFSRCAQDRLPDGWWTDLELPRPSDTEITGVVSTAEGQQISIHNGTDRLERFLEDAIRGFSIAGIPEPRVDSVTFEPSRSCTGRSGRVIDARGQRAVFICIYESDLCAASDTCLTPTSKVRVAALHELGHAWMLDHVDSDSRQQLLELSGRDSWQDNSAPWADRGVEYAADVIAWGLIGEQIEMVRIGSPDCRELTAAFRLLTTNDPLGSTTGCTER